MILVHNYLCSCWRRGQCFGALLVRQPLLLIMRAPQGFTKDIFTEPRSMQYWTFPELNFILTSARRSSQDICNRVISKYLLSTFTFMSYIIKGTCVWNVSVIIWVLYLNNLKSDGSASAAPCTPLSNMHINVIKRWSAYIETEASPRCTSWWIYGDTLCDILYSWWEFILLVTICTVGDIVVEIEG